MEAEALEEGILLKPVTVVELRKAWKHLVHTLGQVEEHKTARKKSPKQAEEEIAAMVKDFRKRPNA